MTLNVTRLLLSINNEAPPAAEAGTLKYQIHNTMSTITTEQSQAITDLLANMTLPSGIGSRESACSIAAINLALTNTLSDDIPPCMSEVIGKWIITTQDAMPDSVHNSACWKALLPLAAGTGRDKESERVAIIIDWVWGVVLPQLQPVADDRGFGEQWKHMTNMRTADAARAAYAAADAAADAADAAADAAQIKSRQQCANIVRKHYPSPPKP